jgi:periplasmic protein TonB
MLNTKRREVIALLGAGGLLLAVKVRRVRAQQPSSAQVPQWSKQVLSALDRKKQYPKDALKRYERGTARVLFSMDRAGRVLGCVVVESSGHAALDEEACNIVRRASPFPAPPNEIKGDPVRLRVPIHFKLPDLTSQEDEMKKMLIGTLPA